MTICESRVQGGESAVGAGERNEMSQWTDALTEKRIEEAKQVYEALEAIGWDSLSISDRRLREALGYLCLERDDISLEGLLDADLGDRQ